MAGCFRRGSGVEIVLETNRCAATHFDVFVFLDGESIASAVVEAISPRLDGSFLLSEVQLLQFRTASSRLQAADPEK